MASVASSRCPGLLLPPSLAGARCHSRPSSTLRLRSRWGRCRPRTLACVAPPDSAEPQTVRSDSDSAQKTPFFPLELLALLVATARFAFHQDNMPKRSYILFHIVAKWIRGNIPIVIPCKSLFYLKLLAFIYGRGQKHVTRILQS
jgi:hypothetical protein